MNALLPVLQNDCEKLCGKVIDHKLLSSDEIQKRYESSVRAWDTYCSPEPYDFLASSASNVTYKSTCGYDIAAAVQRQRNFNYQRPAIAKCVFDLYTAQQPPEKPVPSYNLVLNACN
ncbi:hypothetical protein COOONC_17454 [Cooperia oncophora]